MDQLLDTLWNHIVTLFTVLGGAVFSVTEKLHFLGPAVLIALFAVLTVCLTKLLNRVIITKRYRALEKNFQHWLELRNQATQCEDREKGNRMARNIDQAELNKAYYDYFFEGLLLGIARKVIPIFFIFGFINEYYQQKNLLSYFGRDYVLKFTGSSGEPTLVGAAFWYFIALLSCYILWSLGKWGYNKLTTQREQAIYAQPVEATSD